MDTEKMDANDVRKKNYHLEATDSAVKVDKLPEVLKRRGFGLKGQSKYKGVKDEDTSGDFETMNDRKRKR
ncbi:hypothetical protein TL16_g12562 [Triparma laevis f. inornata]|uniref:Micro-fibrillar-associated protein 1 C-terminal domain-containing protein n=1 Tax=Triparma laevis f. inornata TaxID=1714386 RepID=A0A9W7BMN1_9STRA|nr:hypothetical protein TL16_g12562 [Triparma laevis f. inornata]